MCCISSWMTYGRSLGLLASMYAKCVGVSPALHYLNCYAHRVRFLSMLMVHRVLCCCIQQVKTPNVDRLAGTSMVFDKASVEPFSSTLKKGPPPPHNHHRLTSHRTSPSPCCAVQSCQVLPTCSVRSKPSQLHDRQTSRTHTNILKRSLLP